MIEAILITIILAAVLDNLQQRRALARAERAAKIATDRLLMAWENHYVIPPEAAVAPDVPDEPDLVLMPELRQIVESWEEPGAREAQLNFIKRELAKGRTQPEVLRLIAEPTVR